MVFLYKIGLCLVEKYVGIYFLVFFTKKCLNNKRKFNKIQKSDKCE